MNYFYNTLLKLQLGSIGQHKKLFSCLVLFLMCGNSHDVFALCWLFLKFIKYTYIFIFIIHHPLISNSDHRIPPFIFIFILTIKHTHHTISHKLCVCVYLRCIQGSLGIIKRCIQTFRIGVPFEQQL